MQRAKAKFSAQRARQRGAAMLFAIAIIVVASLLGAGIARMVRFEQLSVAREVLSTRALLAADSGAQLAVASLFGGASCSTAVNSSSYSFNGISGLGNCSASIACTRYDASGVGVPEASYSIVATGSCGANDPAVRRIEMVVRDL